MSKLIDGIKEQIDMDNLGERCASFAESIEYTDDNIIVLQISIEDFKKENFDNIIEIGRVAYNDWERLKTLVPEGEVEAIKKEFEEDLELYSEDEDNGVDSEEHLYKSVLYCENEYVWGATSF